MYRRTKESFHWDFWPSRWDSKEEKEYKEAMRNELENIPGFHYEQPGRWNTNWAATYNSSLFQYKVSDSDYSSKLPSRQTGYEYKAFRAGERQISYQLELPHVRPKFVLRRSACLIKLEVPSWLETLEDWREAEYPRGPIQALATDQPRVAMVTQDNLQKRSNEEIQEALLTNILADHARLTKLISHLNGQWPIKRTGQNQWQVKYAGEIDNYVVQCLDVLPGNWGTFKRPHEEEARTCDKLIVEKVKNNIITLRQGTTNRLQRHSLLNEIKIGQVHKLDVEFSVPETAHKLQTTAVLDCMSGMKNFFPQREKVPEDGKPLVPALHLEQLSRGIGFFNAQLDGDQQAAVIGALQNKLPNTPYTIIGGPGTGKSAVLIEIVRQVEEYGFEKRPNEGLILFVTKSNAGVADLVRKLVAAGVPGEKVVHLLADRVDAPPDTAQYAHRAKDFELLPEHQILVATPMTMARLALLKCRNSSGELRKQYSSLLCIIDEAPSISAAAAIAAMLALGEPVRYIQAGDPNQLGVKCLSKVTPAFFGLASTFDLSRGSTWYYVDPDRYLLHEDAGYHLWANYRCTPPLAITSSDLFYDGRMVPAPTQTMEELAALLTQLRSQNLFSDITGTTVWVNHCGQCTQDPVTGSWSNTSEVQRVGEVAQQLARALGKEKLTIVSGYAKQVQLLQAALPGITAATIDDIQGQENVVAVISLVRSSLQEKADVRSFLVPTIGFLSDRRRLNVMTSRARCLNVIVGDFNHFKKTGSPDWQKLIAYACQAGNI